MEDEAPGVFELGDAVEGYDVVHYVGFGRFTSDYDALALGGDGEYGIEYADLDELAQSLNRGTPQLVMLQLLQGRTNDIAADFSVLAPPLMERAGDIPAVIASQHPIAPRTATKFNDTLYEQLGRGTSVDVAVQEARSKLAWGRLSVSHALFVGRPGELCLLAPGRDVVQPSAQGAYGGSWLIPGIRSARRWRPLIARSPSSRSWILQRPTPNEPPSTSSSELSRPRISSVFGER